MGSQDEYVCYEEEGMPENNGVGGEYLYSDEPTEVPNPRTTHDRMPQNDGVGGEYLYSDEPTEVPNPRTTQNDRKKRPVSRQDSNLYDLADNEGNLYDSISLDENEKTCKPNVPTKQKVQKRQTKENERDPVTTRCTKNCVGKKCILVSILCAIIVIGVGAITGAVVYSYSTTGIFNISNMVFQIFCKPCYLFILQCFISKTFL